MWENDEVVRTVIDIEFTWQKADPKNNENVIEFKWTYAQGEDEEHIVKANLIESLQKQVDRYIFQNK